MSNNSWQSLRLQVSKEIMNTDILCEIMYQPGEKEKAQKCLDEVLSMLKNFESRFSRFRKNNELWNFNHQEESLLSPELFNILSSAQYFYRLTNGLFDPSILPALEKEGYVSNCYTLNGENTKNNLSLLLLESAPQKTKKPLDLMLDLGGIGKGYIVDQVVAYLSLHFENFIIDAGGDIYTRGTNKKEDYPYWVIEIEHPDAENDPVALLLLKNMAVATSGRNRRHWIQKEKEKHHIIDPRTAESASLDFLSITVIAGSTTSADILAKVLFIAGRELAYDFAEKFKIPAVFIDKGGEVIINSYAQNYVWQS